MSTDPNQNDVPETDLADEQSSQAPAGASAASDPAGGDAPGDGSAGDDSAGDGGSAGGEVESTKWTRPTTGQPSAPSISELSDDDLYHGDDEEADEGEVEDVEPLEIDLDDEEESEEELEFQWYILKVQVNREDSICKALWRRVRMHGMEDFFREIIVPTEEVAEFTKSGKRRVVKKKLFPGYIMANMAVTDESWFLVRETSGIGDFTGSGGKPTPMDPREVEKIIRPPVSEEDGEAAQPRPAIPFSEGDRVRVKDGHFQNFEGEVSAVDETHGRVTVMINIFGRPTPVQLEHWQIESI